MCAHCKTIFQTSLCLDAHQLQFTLLILLKTCGLRVHKLIEDARIQQSKQRGNWQKASWVALMAQLGRQGEDNANKVTCHPIWPVLAGIMISWYYKIFVHVPWLTFSWCYSAASEYHIIITSLYQHYMNWWTGRLWSQRHLSWDCCPDRLWCSHCVMPYQSISPIFSWI
jgi:hypothetical protein